MGGERRRADLRLGAPGAPVLPPEHPVPPAPARRRVGRHGERHRDRGARDPPDARPAQPDLRPGDRPDPRADRGGHPPQLLARRRRGDQVRAGGEGGRAVRRAGEALRRR